jgi:hypothetical protein
MRIIRIHKWATLSVEKSEGDTAVAREVFPHDEEATQELVQVEQEQDQLEDLEDIGELSEYDKDPDEKADAENIQNEDPDYQIYQEPSDGQEPSEQRALIDNSVMSTITEAINTDSDLSIAYTTLKGYEIVRHIDPIQIYTAGTGNIILLTETYDWGGEHRAYVINNITDIKKTKDESEDQHINEEIHNNNEDQYII